MISIVRTNSKSKHFVELVKELDAYLAITDGDDHSFYDQFNQLDDIEHVVVAYLKNLPIGCGALKPLGPDSVEVKRMYVDPIYRGKGVGSKILTELEEMAREQGMSACYLETGIRQADAIALYSKSGYVVTENYGPYAGVEGSVCLKKTLERQTSS